MGRPNTLQAAAWPSPPGRRLHYLLLLSALLHLLLIATLSRPHAAGGQGSASSAPLSIRLQTRVRPQTVAPSPPPPRSRAATPPARPARHSAHPPAVSVTPVRRASAEANRASPAPAAPSAPAASPADLADDQPPAYRMLAQPPYPLWSRSHREQGTVLLRVRVSRNGQALQVELARSSGFPRLDNAALAAVHDWQFFPARRHGQPVDDEVMVPVQFSLQRP